MENQPSFERIVGGTDEEKKEVEKEAQEASSQTGEELFGEYLVVPTEGEKHAINLGVTHANAIAEKYGSTRQVSPERVFLLRTGGVKLATKGDVKQGVNNSFNQSIGVERSPSNAILAASVFHETCHGASYHSEQIIEDGTGRPYRSGITMSGRDQEGEYFGVAEEAIIATLSKEFFKNVLSNDPLYKEEIEKTNKIKDWLIAFIEKNAPKQKQETAIAIIRDILVLPQSEEVLKTLEDPAQEDAYKFGFFGGFFEKNFASGNIMHERAKERGMFESTLDEIVADSKGALERKDLFEDFVRAHFTGNYMPLARKIEAIYGPGSFRVLATSLGNIKSDAE